MEGDAHTGAMQPSLPATFEHRKKRLRDLSAAAEADQELALRERWNQRELLQFQKHRLNALVRHAVRRSPFYRELYQGVQLEPDVRLDMLPVITKDLVLQNFDRLVTDPRLRSDALDRYVRAKEEPEHYLGTFHILQTAGSSGRRGIFVFDCMEWGVVLASWLRCRRFMGERSQSGPGTRFASVAGNAPFHTTYRMAASLDIGIPRPLRLDATASLHEMVSALNAFRPEMVMLYPSMVPILATEQVAGRLLIHPSAIVTAGEWRTPEAEAIILEAWGVKPFNDYAMTEGPVGMDCGCHRGIHVFEDLSIVEVVDSENRPVPAGSRGDKILFTNLFNYTQPLIRYEVSDLVRASSEPCPCGRPFSLIEAVEGRLDDVLYLRGVNGKTLPIHPHHFVEAIKGLAGETRYQVIEHDGIEILVERAGPVGPTDALGRSILASVRTALEAAGVECPPLRLRFVTDLEGHPQLAGKLKTVYSLRSSASRPRVSRSVETTRPG